MKLDIKAFSFTLLIIGTIPLLILFTWCGINGFGTEVVILFESIHPSGGLSIINNMDGTFISRLPGIIINTLYAAVDNFLLGFFFSTLYNFFATKFNK